VKKELRLQEIQKIQLNLQKPCLVFLYWDLWAGKTTLSQSIINNQLSGKVSVTSPTYVYYNRYEDIYHFDLYRIRDYDEFVSIGWEEILDNNDWIILIEWPELLEKYYTPDIKIILSKTQDNLKREIEIESIIPQNHCFG